MTEPILKRRAAFGIAACLALVASLVAVSPSSASHAEPQPETPLGAFAFDLTFDEQNSSGVSGTGYLQVPGTGSDVKLTVEIDGFGVETEYNVRLGGPAAVGMDASCSDVLANNPPTDGDNGQFQLGGVSQRAEGGTLRASYDGANFTGNRATKLNAGEYVILVTDIPETQVLACADLSAGVIANPTQQTYPLALVGGMTPVNPHGVVVSGQATRTGTKLNYQLTVTGDALILNGNRMVFLRSTADCGTSTWETTNSNIVRALTNNSSTDAPAIPGGLTQAFNNMGNATGTTTLSIENEVLLSAAEMANVAGYGIMVYGLETGDSTQPGGDFGTFQRRELTPVACITLVDQAAEVPPEENQPPVANAGPDQTVTIADGQTTAPVTFAGSATDDGTTLTYAWSGPVALDPVAAPSANLPAGTHTFTLTVTDDGTPALMDTDDVVITVNPATTFNGTIAEATTVDQIIAASDYKPAVHGEILSLYQAVLAREPDVPGAQYWINTVFEAPGVLRSVNGTVLTTDNDKLIRITFFIATVDQPEYAAKYAGITSDGDFVDAVYMNVFGRAADAAGKAFWVESLQNGLERPQMIRFLNASEEGICLNPLGRDTSSFTHPACLG